MTMDAASYLSNMYKLERSDWIDVGRKIAFKNHQTSENIEAPVDSIEAGKTQIVPPNWRVYLGMYSQALWDSQTT